MSVMSSAYPVMFMSGLVGVGISARYKLKREGESTPPWGTPVLNICVFELWLLKVVKPCLPCI